MAENHNKLRLIVVSQERKILEEEIESLTAPGSEGELTILPHHLPLFTQLQAGVLTYRNDKDEDQIVISKGFLDVGPNGEITIMVDTATHAREISLNKAEKAVAAAEETMKTASRDQREFLLAEASLKQALLEMKVFQNRRKS